MGSSGTDSPSDAPDAGDPTQSFGNSDSMVPMMFTALDSGADASGPIEDDPDDDSCGSVELEPMVNTEVEKGTLLLVFDNSGSMSALWGDTPRWLAAGNAIRDAVSSISEFVTVGAIVFPSPTSIDGCMVSSIESEEQIRFLPGGTFVQAWDNFLARNAPTGGTPLGGGLLAADAALASDELEGIVSVVVLTDGEPGCDTSPLSTLPPMWLERGIRTHVVGLPGTEGAVTVLDALAIAGGTEMHLTPDNPRALRQQLANIVSQTVISALPSCTIPLDPPAPNIEDVHVIVTEGGKRQDAERDLGEGGGWMINAAGSEVELFGAFCDQGLAGHYDRISIEYGCVDLPPLPQPMVM